MEQLFAEAIAHHQAGRLPQAEQGYRQVLAIEPRHADCLHLLGLIAHQVGRDDIAVDLIGQALGVEASFPVYHSSLGVALTGLGRGEDALAALDTSIRLAPDYAEAHSNRGNALRSLSRFDEAAAAYETAVRFNPAFLDAHYNLGSLRKDLGRLEGAVFAYEAAIAIRPDLAEAHVGLGLSLAGLGRAEDAVAAFTTAIALKPDAAESHYDLGNVLKTLGRLDEAVAAYDIAIGLRPGLAQAHSNRGAALAESGRFIDAIAAYDAAILAKPDLAEAHTNRGNVFADLGRLEDAVSAHDRAIGLKADFPEAHYNRANALMRLGRLEEAVAAYDAAVRFDATYVDAHSNRGGVLNGLGRFDDAVAAYGAAIRLEPTYAKAHYNEAFAHLLRGDYAAGWPKYEWRWRGGCPGLESRGFGPPQWQGEDIAGLVILLHAEQGLGDTIQFCRYAALVAAKGAHVIIEARRPLLRLLSSLAGVDQLVAFGDPLPDFDLHCPLMSLPGVFGTTVATVPGGAPYLRAEDQAVEAWRAQIGSSGFKIGITWQGNPTAAAEQGRSAPLTSFAPLARVPGVRLISLQKVHGLDQLDHLPSDMRVETLGDDFDEGPDAFIDTAGVMMNLDLILTVDTATGHLAGALGRPVWLALQQVPHWVWMMQREDTPWYPNTRLFRQTDRGDWAGVFGRMAQALGGLKAARS